MTTNVLTKITKNITYNNGKINITAQFNRRMSNCIMYIKFSTSEDKLLYLLLSKYIREKVLINGINPVNDIVNAYCTTKGINIVCVEKRFFNNIINIVSYICKNKLTKREMKLLSANECDYNKLHNDLKNFDVYVTGKVKSVMRVLSNANDNKLDRFITAMNNIVIKQYDTVSNDSVCELQRTSYSQNERNKLDFCMFMETEPFVFNGNDVILLDPSVPCRICSNYNIEYVANKTHSMFISCGTPGTPAANDTNGVKHKAKCNYILECLNMLLFMIADIHGFKYEIKNINEINDRTTQDSKNCIKTLVNSISC